MIFCITNCRDAMLFSLYKTRGTGFSHAWGERNKESEINITNCRDAMLASRD